MNLITHLDADAFFASVEQASDSRLRGRPIAVGGEKRGIIASASYEARRFGIYTPMPTVRARKLCPKLVVLPGDLEKYERFSRWMFSDVYDFTPDVEISSMDEGYFDLTAVPRDPVEVARTIRGAIHDALKLTVSEGIGSSKRVSQIASKLHKPAAFHAVPAGGGERAEEGEVHAALPKTGGAGVSAPEPGTMFAEHVRAGGLRGAHPADLRGVCGPESRPGRRAASGPGEAAGKQGGGDRPGVRGGGTEAGA